MKNPQSINLEDFVNKIVADKKEFGELEPEVVEQIKKDLLARAEDRVKAVIIANIPETKFPEFEKLLEKENNEEEVRVFCEANIPDLDQHIAAELIVFQQSYLS